MDHHMAEGLDTIRRRQALIALCRGSGQSSLSRLALKVGLSEEAARRLLDSSPWFVVEDSLVELSPEGVHAGRAAGMLAGQVPDPQTPPSDEEDEEEDLDEEDRLALAEPLRLARCRQLVAGARNVYPVGPSR